MRRACAALRYLPLQVGQLAQSIELAIGGRQHANGKLLMQPPDGSVPPLTSIAAACPPTFLHGVTVAGVSFEGPPAVTAADPAAVTAYPPTVSHVDTSSIASAIAAEVLQKLQASNGGYALVAKRRNVISKGKSVPPPLPRGVSSCRADVLNSAREERDATAQSDAQVVAAMRRGEGSAGAQSAAPDSSAELTA